MHEGVVWYEGWDIPGHWAVDAKGRSFADFGAHGCCMKSVPLAAIISELEGNSDLRAASVLRKLGGRKPMLPSWISAALSQGWTPPQTFRREDYE